MKGNPLLDNCPRNRFPHWKMYPYLLFWGQLWNLGFPLGFSQWQSWQVQRALKKEKGGPYRPQNLTVWPYVEYIQSFFMLGVAFLTSQTLASCLKYLWRLYSRLSGLHRNIAVHQCSNSHKIVNGSFKKSFFSILTFTVPPYPSKGPLLTVCNQCWPLVWHMPFY